MLNFSLVLFLTLLILLFVELLTPFKSSPKSKSLANTSLDRSKNGTDVDESLRINCGESLNSDVLPFEEA